MQQVSGPDRTVGEIAVGSLVGGRYRLDARIGSGGMATIYRGRDLTLERDVAVKVLHPHLADDASVLARFRTEARHAAALVHPHIVHVYDQGESVQPWIVMEHIDGPSLRDVIRERGRLTPAEALALVEPVSLALSRAHAAGVVHRDIKPENVLVAADGVAKVADFGIARALAETNHTQTGTLIGSVHYLAPELVEGRDASFASDQYALGVLLFELLTGRKALTAESPMAVALRHGREPIPAPSSIVPELAPEVDAVVARATAMDPGDRYPDLRAFVADLTAAVPGGAAPVEVSRSDGEGGERTLIIPPPGELGLSEEDATFPPVGTARAPRLADRPETVGPPTPADPAGTATAPVRTRRRGRRIAVGALVGLLVLAVLAGGAFAAWNFLIAPVQQVPNLAETPEAEARERLGARQLELVVSGAEDSRTVPEGAIISQDPAPGSQLRSGEAVTVVLSSGPAGVEVPRVLDLPLDEARALLEAEPLFLEIERVDESFSFTVPAGAVVGQSPDPGTELRQGDAVTLNVSLGIEQVEVPDLDGLERDAAEAALVDAGLTATFSESFSDSVPTRGLVVSQGTAPGEAVDIGSPVEVVISLGPRTVTVPDLVGESIPDAQASLRALGLEPVLDLRPRRGLDRIFAANRVTEMSPAGGASVVRGTSVTLRGFSGGGEDDEDDEDD
jgi:eukaryotic-like serine/threonine-protein kinase